jgi:hypothetical protein
MYAKHSKANIKKHEIHPAIGAPLWWTGSFLRRHWKAKAWIASVIVAFYLPYMLHEHATYLDDHRCDRISYASQVAYQYGCYGRDCTPDKEAYDQTVQLLFGSVSAGCYAPAPLRPDEVFDLVIDSFVQAFDDASDVEVIIPPEGEQILASVEE